MNWMNLIALIPIIAAGIQSLHADATLGSKTQMASDSLELAIAGASALAPASEQPTVTAFGTLAQQVLASTVTTLHNTGATPAALPVAAA